MKTILLGLVVVSACKGRDDASATAQSQRGLDLSVAMEEVAAGSGAALDDGEVHKRVDRAGLFTIAEAPAPEAKVPSGSGVRALGGKGSGAGNGANRGRGGPPDDKPVADSEDAVRSWFPETFLFEPRIVTDANGQATVPVRVPDRLTTWRVLALAHSRDGAQGGTTTSFIGTLPAYVDLVVPKFLVIGDEVKLPIQIVNTTETPVTSALTVEAQNATLIGGGGTKTVPAQSGIVEYATLKATKAGTITVRAGLAGTDAVRHTIEVRPSGRPETVTRSGTLAQPRTVIVQGPAGSDPATDRVRLLVYPGALSLLRAELGVSTFRSSVADDAYALLLAGRADSLLTMLGDTADPEALRTLSIIAGQRAIRWGRNLDVDRAGLLVEAALAHPQNPVLARLGERAAAYLAQQQRPDGTFAGATGWTLQRVLVATADATRAVASAHLSTTERQRAQAVAARAGAAFQRNLEHVQDPFTAAAILASGAAKGALADTLRERVRAGIKDEADGTKYLDVPSGVVRADGTVPSRAEATALAVLALDGDPQAPLADLGGTLLGAYSPERGWGDGRANLACMQAVVALFKTPVPAGVKITLLMDGVPVTEGTLDREALREVLALEAAAPPSGFAGAHEWKIVADPAVPGLGYSLALRGYVPWQPQTTQQGLEMTVTPAPVTAQVGKPVELTIEAIAPSHVEVRITQALPAGVQVDTASLDALVAAGTISKYDAADGTVELTVPPLDPGERFTATYKVIPTLAGTLRSAASTIATGSTKFSVPPASWTVR